MNLQEKKLFYKKFLKNKEKNEKYLLELFQKNEIKIEETYKKIIINLLKIKNMTVKEIFIPRIDVISIDIKSDYNEIVKIISEKGFSRLPVYDKTIDNIVGILHSKELLKHSLNPEERFEISKLLRTPLFVPESKLVIDLLHEFREKKTHMAIVVDEYGGMSGIICLEDIIEQIVGDIQDEFDNESEDIQKISENCYLLNARIPIKELNEKFNLDFNEEEFETLGGAIYMLFGKIPTVNEKVKYKNFIFTIESIQERKIKLIKMEIEKENNLNENNNIEKNDKE